MRVTEIHSGTIKRRNGDRPIVHIELEPETPLELALMRLASASPRKVYIWDTGRATIDVEPGVRRYP